MASSSEQKYVILRKRLDQFGYKQPLAIESLPLVEKLFQDLIHTTEALKKAKDVKIRLFAMKIDRFVLESCTRSCLSIVRQWDDEFLVDLFVRPSL